MVQIIGRGWKVNGNWQFDLEVEAAANLIETDYQSYMDRTLDQAMADTPLEPLSQPTRSQEEFDAIATADARRMDERLTQLYHESREEYTDSVEDEGLETESGFIKTPLGTLAFRRNGRDESNGLAEYALTVTLHDDKILQAAPRPTLPHGTELLTGQHRLKAAQSLGLHVKAIDRSGILYE